MSGVSASGGRASAGGVQNGQAPPGASSRVQTDPQRPHLQSQPCLFMTGMSRAELDKRCGEPGAN